MLGMESHHLVRMCLCRKFAVVFDQSPYVNVADTAYAVQETPVQSVISEPSASSSVSADDGYVTVRGYAFSGGGRGIARVDLSLDGGETWLNAELDNNGTKAFTRDSIFI